MHPPKIQSFKNQIYFNLSQKITQKEISFSSHYLHENQIFFILHMHAIKNENFMSNKRETWKLKQNPPIYSHFRSKQLKSIKKLIQEHELS
jgi:hypothetical protein